ncbi:MAG: hypothetical protein R2710_05565 [Acidimicrobiales bacterium]
MPAMTAPAAKFTLVMPEPQKRSSVARGLGVVAGIEGRPSDRCRHPGGDLRTGAPDDVIDLGGIEMPVGGDFEPVAATTGDDPMGE